MRHTSLIDVITDEQEANLRTLAAYLFSLPSEYPDFEMSLFVNDKRLGSAASAAHHPVCGTAACAVGHGPAAGFAPTNMETWAEYSTRLFIGQEGGSTYDAWRWCFDGYWSKVDNTVHGAAKRILWLLDNGLPEDACAQRWGDVDLCYTDMPVPE